MATDPTIEQLSGLSPTMARIAVEIINAFRDAGIPLGIVAKGGRRDPQTQQRLVNAGYSATTKSAHLTGDAVDFDVLGFPRKDLPPQFFSIIGQFGESYGLVWGGRWKHPYDPMHFELPKSMRQVA